MSYVIAGDLGGTKSAWGAFSVTKDLSLGDLITAPIALLNNDYSSFKDVCIAAEKELGAKFVESQGICIGAAGVWNSKERVVALPHYWKGTANIKEMEVALKLDPQKILILNDFEAEVRSVRTKVAKEALLVRKGSPLVESDKTILLGPGTGLGVAALSDIDNRVIRSEGGNMPISYPRSEFLREYWNQIISYWNKSDIITPRYEDILSGNGLSDLHYVLTGTRKTPEEISTLILKDSNIETARAFSEILGIFCQAISYLYWLPSHLYLTGGVLKKNPTLAMLDVMKVSFEYCHAHREELHTVSISLITDPYSALYGAGEGALTLIKR